MIIARSSTAAHPHIIRNKGLSLFSERQCIALKSGKSSFVHKSVLPVIFYFYILRTYQYFCSEIHFKQTVFNIQPSLLPLATENCTKTNNTAQNIERSAENLRNRVIQHAAAKIV